MLKDNVDTSTKDKDSIGCDVDMNITGNGSNGTRIVERIFSFIVYNKHLSVLLSIINNFQFYYSQVILVQIQTDSQIHRTHNLVNKFKH